MFDEVESSLVECGEYLYIYVDYTLGHDGSISAPQLPNIQTGHQTNHRKIAKKMQNFTFRI